MKNKHFLARLFLVLCLVCSYAWASGYALRNIQSGESLASIAQLYNISVDALMSFNELDSELIHPGTVLKIPYTAATGGIAEIAPTLPPGFRSHTLARGESLSSLSDDYRLSLDALIGANPNISSLDQLPMGIELLIPPSEGLVITLQAGEQLTEIIREYGLDPVTIMNINKFTSPSQIGPGAMVFLPGVEPTRALERLARVRAEENRYIWPVHGRITSYFGRRNLGMGTASFHSAIDVAAPTGTAVVASRSGTVSEVGWSDRGYGNLVKIRHAGGAETWYAHNSKIYVSEGEHVEQGETIAAVGSTGLSTGPHLHFELHEQDEAIDPLTYLR